MRIYLLGTPYVDREGERVPAPKGKKVWALLAYLLRSEVPPSRGRLASLLFADADDPLSALRWNLAELRRLLGDARSVVGEPVELRLPPGTFVDVRVVTSGTWVEAVEVPGLGRDLLEGMTFSSSPAFDAWLLTERRHLVAAAASVLREAALARLTNDPNVAVALGRRLVEIDPLDEAAHMVLVRALATAGDKEAARRHVAACRQLFLRELGVEPSDAVALAAESERALTGSGTRGGLAAGRALLETGEAAITAGAVDSGIESLRRAVAEARDIGDHRLLAECLVALGSALIHSVRGRDDEGTATMLEAAALAPADAPALVAAAYREVAYAELLRARYDRSEHWAMRALDVAGDDRAKRAGSLTVLGAAYGDMGRHEEALDMLTEAVDEARSVDGAREEAFAQSFLARSRLLRREVAEARAAAEAAVRLARSAGWMSFIPWPESLLAEVDLVQGDAARAEEAFQHAFALGCQLGDPCWEAMGARGVGMIEAGRGDYEAAIATLDDARRRCVRLPDAFLWIEAYTLDALCGVALDAGADGAKRWIDDLDALASRTGMREFVVRAYLHRDRMGDHTAGEAALLLARDTQNPWLKAEVEAATTAVSA